MTFIHLGPVRWRRLPAEVNAAGPSGAWRVRGRTVPAAARLRCGGVVIAVVPLTIIRWENGQRPIPVLAALGLKVILAKPRQ